MGTPATREEIKDFFRTKPFFPGKARNRLRNHTLYSGLEEQKDCAVEILIYEEALSLWTTDLFRLISGGSMDDVFETSGAYCVKAITRLLETSNYKEMYPDIYKILEMKFLKYKRYVGLK